MVPWLAGLSLANILLFRVWGGMLGMPLRYMARVPLTEEFLAMFLDVVFLGMVIGAVMYAAERIKSAWIRASCQWAVFLICVAGFRPARVEILLWDRWSWWGAVLWSIGLGAVSYLFGRYRKQVYRGMRAACLITVPFLVVTFSRLLFAAYALPHEYLDLPPAPFAEVRPSSPRVVWVVFDEFDQKVAFDLRPAALSLPEFDRFRMQALNANNAFAPSGTTLVSMPSYLLGRVIHDAVPRTPNDLQIAERDGVKDAWAGQQNIFDRARGLGFNTALAGWYHPYCRIIGRSLNRCWWMADPDSDANLSDNLSGRMGNIALMGLDGAVRVGHTSLLDQDVLFAKLRREKLIQFQEMMLVAKNMITDSRLQLVVLHLPLPHPSVIYDRRAQAFSTRRNLSYLDNLALADRALGELRTTMERAGTWDNTAVIITSDHWWRINIWKSQPGWSTEDEHLKHGKIDTRIPFMIKLPNQVTASTFESRFNTVITGDLCLAILDGKVKDVEGLREWLSTVSALRIRESR